MFWNSGCFKLIHKCAAIAAVLLLVGCSGNGFEAARSANEDSFTSINGLSEAEMAAKFAETLQPTLRANCASCHGSIQAPKHSVADPVEGMRIILANKLVDLTNPANSRLVAKILGGHQSFPSTLATQLQNDIQDWADAMKEAPPTDTQAPAVMINSPAANATVSGTINFSAIATDNIGVAGVQFNISGIDVGTEDLTAPYSFTWNTAAVPNGTYNLTVRARDTAGNKTTSAVVTVTVNNVITDTTSPTVAITAPLAAAMVSGSTVTISANAMDNVGVFGVQFMVDGVNQGTEDFAPPYSIVWNTNGLVNGTHTISARARDAAGNTMTSTAVTVTVANMVVANPNAKYTWIAANIITPKCLNCHGDIGTYDGLKAIVNPGNAAGSLLYTETNSGKMPKDAAKLSTTEIAAIRDWINGGALNN